MKIKNVKKHVYRSKFSEIEVYSDGFIGKNAVNIIYYFAYLVYLFTTTITLVIIFALVVIVCEAPELLVQILQYLPLVP